MVRIIGNGVAGLGDAPKLSCVGLWLNASKSESVLDGTLNTSSEVLGSDSPWVNAINFRTSTQNADTEKRNY